MRVGGAEDVAADGPLVALPRDRVPGAALPPPALQPRLRRLADGALRALDPLAPVQAGDHLGTLGFGGGQRVALRRLPPLAAGGVAESELELARDALARAVVDALVGALGQADAPGVRADGGARFAGGYKLHVRARMTSTSCAGAMCAR